MKKLLVVFDDTCPTCTAGKKISEHLDNTHAIEFVGMNTEHGKQLISEHGLNMSESAYSIEGNTSAAKSAMVKQVLAHNGIVGVIVSLPFRIPWLGDKLYDLIASHRAHTEKSQ